MHHHRPDTPGAARLRAALLAIRGVGELGDFIGISALLALGHQLTGGLASGSAMIFAAQAVPALLAGTVASGRLSSMPGRRLLVAGELVGLLGVLAALVSSTMAGMLTAAVAIGCARAAKKPALDRLRTQALAGGENKRMTVWLSMVAMVGQIGGFLLGGALVAAGAANVALGVDAATFALGALLALGVPALPGEAAPRRVSDALEVLADARVRPMLGLVAGLLIVNAVPEVLATSLVRPEVLGAALAAGAVGSLLASPLQLRHAERSPAAAVWWGALGPVGMAAVALAVAYGHDGWGIVAAHVVIGAGMGGVVLANARLAGELDAGAFAQLGALLSAAIVVFDGVASPLVAAVVDVAGPLAGTAAAAAASGCGVALSALRLRSAPKVAAPAADVT